MRSALSSTLIATLLTAGFTINNFDDYVLAAGKTELFPKGLTSATAVDPWKIRFAHACFGLGSENGELITALRPDLVGTGFHGVDLINLGEELGDRMWYLAIFSAIVADLQGAPATAISLFEQVAMVHDYTPLRVPRNLTAMLADLIEVDGEIANQGKRALFYEKPLDNALVMKSIVKAHAITFDLCLHYGLNPLEVAARNILKLDGRKKKAAAEKETVGSLNRDLNAERTALGG